MTLQTANTAETIHALIPAAMKQSIKDFCSANDINESQLVRKAINLVLTKANQS